MESHSLWMLTGEALGLSSTPHLTDEWTQGPREDKARYVAGERQKDTDRWWQTQIQRTDKWGIRDRHRDGSGERDSTEGPKDGHRKRGRRQQQPEETEAGPQGRWARMRPGPKGQARH